MSKLKREIDSKIVKSINKNVRSSTKKLNPILKSIVGKKVDVVIRDLSLILGEIKYFSFFFIVCK